MRHEFLVLGRREWSEVLANRRSIGRVELNIKTGGAGDAERVLWWCGRRYVVVAADARRRANATRGGEVNACSAAVRLAAAGRAGVGPARAAVPGRVRRREALRHWTSFGASARGASILGSFFDNGKRVRAARIVGLGGRRAHGDELAVRDSVFVGAVSNGAVGNAFSLFHDLIGFGLLEVSLGGRGDGCAGGSGMWCVHGVYLIFLAC
jgi:hypothetical protein